MFLKEYEKLVKKTGSPPELLAYLSCCQFLQGMYADADVSCQKAPRCRLQNRLLFHLSHKLSDERKLMQHHQQLHDVPEDQLTLASMHYLRYEYSWC